VSENRMKNHLEGNDFGEIDQGLEL
jgi:hypothetical protein